MGIETMFLISAGLSVAQGFMQYREQKKADKAARQRSEAEARLMEQDAERAALEEKRLAEKERRRQKMAFLKSGVTLEGSPLLVMEETRRKGEENVKNVRDSAKARANLVRQEGSVSRANLFGTALDTASSVTNSYSNMQLMKKQLG